MGCLRWAGGPAAVGAVARNGNLATGLVALTAAAALVHLRRRAGVVPAVVALAAQIVAVLAFGSSELPARLARCAFTMVCIIGIVRMTPSPQRLAVPPPPPHPPLQV